MDTMWLLSAAKFLKAQLLESLLPEKKVIPAKKLYVRATGLCLCLDLQTLSIYSWEAGCVNGLLG